MGSYTGLYLKTYESYVMYILNWSEKQILQRCSFFCAYHKITPVYIGVLSIFQNSQLTPGDKWLRTDVMQL